MAGNSKTHAKKSKKPSYYKKQEKKAKANKTGKTNKTNYNKRAVSRSAKLKEKQKEKEKAERAAMEAERNRQMEIVRSTLENDKFVEFITSNVGRYAIEVMKRLGTPKTDDVLAAELNVKVNEVRRVLNLLGGYGIAKYDTNKDKKGWLTFSWYIDTEKLTEFATKLGDNQEKEISLPEDCDDFFICEKCYPSNKVVLPFDSAFEHSFKCPDCGRPLKRLSKQETSNLLSAYA
ncbi:MAG: hypothetical protein ACP5T4_03495 [Candidatus Micrarchaeia archaeon]